MLSKLSIEMTTPDDLLIVALNAQKVCAELNQIPA